MLIQAVGVNAIRGDRLLLSSRQLPYRCHISLASTRPLNFCRRVLLYFTVSLPTRRAMAPAFSTRPAHISLFFLRSSDLTSGVIYSGSLGLTVIVFSG